MAGEKGKIGLPIGHKSSIRSGIVLTYVRLAISLILALLYPPFLLRTVGKADNGLYQFAVAVVSFLLLFSLGSENSYVRFATRAQERNGEDGVAEINGFYLLLFGLIGLVELAAGVVVAFLFRNGVFAMNDSSISVATLFWVFLILAVSSAGDFFLSLFSWYAYYRSRFVFMQLLLLVSHVATIGLATMALLMGGGILWVAAIGALVLLLADLGNVLYCFRVLHMRFSIPQRPSFSSLGSEVLTFSLYIFLAIIVSQINANLGKTVLGSVGDSGMVTVYSYGYQFYVYAALISVGISDSFLPRVNEMALQRDDPQVNSLFLSSSTLQMVVMLGLLGGFASCGLDFVTAWLAGSDLIPGELAGVFYLGLGFLALGVIPLSETVGLEIQRARNQHRFLALFNLGAALIGSVLTLVFTVYLPSPDKIYGPLLGMAVQAVAGPIVATNLYYQKHLHLPMGPFFAKFARLLGAALLGWVVPFLVYSYGISLPLSLNGYLTALIKGVTFLIVFLPLAYASLQKEIRAWFARQGKKAGNSSKNTL